MDDRTEASVLLSAIGAKPSYNGSATIGTEFTYASQYSDTYAIVLRGSKGLSNNVVLGAAFDGQSTAAQGVTLLHELMHYASNKDDAQIDAQYGIPMGNSASAAFNNWLTMGCTKQSHGGGVTSGGLYGSDFTLTLFIPVTGYGETGPIFGDPQWVWWPEPHPRPMSVL